MDLRQLRYFYHVAKNGSFTQAAEKLHIAQPALSMHVRRLEEELGVSLLLRGARGIKVTEAGNRLLKHASLILDELALIPDSVRDQSTAPRGFVRLGVEGTILDQLAVPVIEQASSLYPDIHIRLIESMSGYLLDWLQRDQLDIAIIDGRHDTKGFAIHRALSEELCLFASTGFYATKELRGDTQDFSELSTLPLIVPTPPHALRQSLENAALLGDVRINPKVEINSYSRIKELVRLGLGVGVLPRNSLENNDDKTGAFDIWHLKNPTIERDVYLAYSTERPLLKATLAMAQLSWNVLRELVRSGEWIAELSDESDMPPLDHGLAQR
jgi:LysR family nitrogen assimilation transcriptional regulator